MVNVVLDAHGRLIDFLAVPPQVDDSEGPWPEPDWSSLHEAAGLSASTLTPAPPAWNPLVASDSRAAWEGTFDGQDDIRIRVEAAAFHGKPVWFQIIPPWHKPSRMEEAPTPPAEVAVTSFFLVVLGAILIGGGLLARRNVRLGRADRRGAFRLAGFALFVGLWSYALPIHHVPAVSEVGLLFSALAPALFEILESVVTF